MSQTLTIALVINGLVFATWAAMMFWTLFRLRIRAAYRAATEKAGMIRKITLSVTTFGLFFSSPDFRADRWRVGLSTLAMILIMVIVALI